MGPIILLDKSTIQSLSDEEMVFLCKHYTPVLPPILILEVLADIKYAGIKPELVPVLANKLHWVTDVLPSFQNIAIANLLGHPIPMDGRIPKEHGRTVKNEKGEKGIFFEEAPERAAIRNWQKSNFSDAEIAMVKRWEEYIRNQDLEEFKRRAAKVIDIKSSVVNSLETLKTFNDAYFSMREWQETLLRNLIGVLSTPTDIQREIWERWDTCKRPLISDFAPYAYFCLQVHMLFYTGLSYGLITPKKHTERIWSTYFICLFAWRLPHLINFK